LKRKETTLSGDKKKVVAARRAAICGKRRRGGGKIIGGGKVGQDSLRRGSKGTAVNREGEGGVVWERRTKKGNKSFVSNILEKKGSQKSRKTSKKRKGCRLQRVCSRSAPGQNLPMTHKEREGGTAEKEKVWKGWQKQKLDGTAGAYRRQRQGRKERRTGERVKASEIILYQICA